MILWCAEEEEAIYLHTTNVRTTILGKLPDKGKTEQLGSSSVEEVFVESKLNKSQLCSLTARWPTKPVWTEVQPGE